MTRYEKITAYVELLEQSEIRIKVTRDLIRTAQKHRKANSLLWGVAFTEQGLRRNLKAYRTQVRGHQAIKRRLIALIQEIPDPTKRNQTKPK